MNRSVWEDNVRRVTPYTPGEQPKAADVVKLNTNENPYSPSDEVKKVLCGYDAENMKLYPDTNASVLADALSSYHGVDPSRIFIGVGSDDVLSMAFLTFFKSDRPILFPDITYSFYKVWADVYGIKYDTVPLLDDFTLDVNGFSRENGGIVIPNPNAPTAVLESVRTIEGIIAANRGSVVIIDEAYIDFGGESVLSLINKYDNLLVTRTFSKSRSMAGMRIGYAMGSEKLIQYLNDVKFSINSYTMNTLSVLCGAASVKDDEYFKKTVSDIIATREYSKKRLSELGFIFTDSKSNFIFAEHKNVKAKEIFDALKQRNIYVRYWDLPRIDNRLRITVGTREQMEKLFKALAQIL